MTPPLRGNPSIILRKNIKTFPRVSSLLPPPLLRQVLGQAPSSFQSPSFGGIKTLKGQEEGFAFSLAGRPDQKAQPGPDSDTQQRGHVGQSLCALAILTAH